MKDLGPLHHFLGIEVQRSANTLHLSQTHYARTILDKARMLDCKPMESKTKGLHDNTSFSDPTFYCSIVGALQYLTLTRLDLSFSVNYVSQYMQSPTIASIKMVRHILRYIKGSITLGLHLTGNTTLDLFAFSDADWQAVLLLDALQRVFALSWEITLFLGVPRNNQSSRFQVLRLNIVQWLTQQLN
eukprot:XP_015573202.1 uncharacterized protein LOC107261068 [Ricinus communis]